MLRKFLENHVLANAMFVVVLLLGIIAYGQMPRAKDPDINFNWISIVTTLPGASAKDVENLITNPLEEAVQGIADVKFSSSKSREGISNILVRFTDISKRLFDRRINDLRREIQNKANDELPKEADDPLIFEITSANSFPTAIVVVRGTADDETLRRTALHVKEDINLIKGVDSVNTVGLNDPELHVEFDPHSLATLGITPSQLADTISAHFKDISAGEMYIGNQEWLVRMVGTDANPTYLAKFPVITAQGEIPVGSLAEISRGRKKAEQFVLYHGFPAVTMSINKKDNAHALQLVTRIKEYIKDKNKVISQLGLNVILLDDQTTPTRDAINVMQKNLFLGLLLVAAVTWIFLGWHIAVFIGIGIPFTLAGTFWILQLSGQTINQSVLLGIVIVLGMLVDDAIVVVEAIYFRIQRGVDAMTAALGALREVFAPVTSSVLTTIAAFLPLMLLPGILGKFMFVIPFVVTLALAVSLIEAYWILPVHISAAKVQFNTVSTVQLHRINMTRRLRTVYSQFLLKALRHPFFSLFGMLFLFVLAIGLIASNTVKVNFFTFDSLRLFYINVKMPPGTTLNETMGQLISVEQKVRKHIHDGEMRDISSTAGQMFTQTEPFFGQQYGHILVSLNPKAAEGRNVQDIVDSLRENVVSTPGPENISFLIMTGGPPSSKPISIKVRGDDYTELRAATDALRDILEGIPAVKDINDDDSPGRQELQLFLNANAVKRAGLNAADMARIIRLFFDGEITASMQHQGEKIEVRVRAKPQQNSDIFDVLRLPIALPNGGETTLRQLVNYNISSGKDLIRHYDFRRVITLEANLDKEKLDTLTVNNMIKEKWDVMQVEFTNVNLDFSGEFDDIQESLDSLLVLFLFGISLMYLILGAQFKSYWQPFLILATIPMAFTGVIFGIAVTGQYLSLFTMYGMVALAGISVNAAIVMIDAANKRRIAGQSVLHATVYAARRRVVPIIITSLTTIAGLFSLAVGLGGESLMWSPVASAIVWGLAFSTILTLFIIPLLYRLVMTKRTWSIYKMLRKFKWRYVPLS